MYKSQCTICPAITTVTRNPPLPTTGAIRTGIAQSDTSLTTEVNLGVGVEKLWLQNVDFGDKSWGEGHTMAESTGDSVTNFIEWVNKCLK